MANRQFVVNRENVCYKIGKIINGLSIMREVPVGTRIDSHRIFTTGSIKVIYGLCLFHLKFLVTAETGIKA